MCSILLLISRVKQNHSSENNLVSCCHSGFKSLHSTANVLLEATAESCTDNVDQGNIKAVVFLDLKKDFDTIDHDVLLSKLKFYGTDGILRIHSWSRCYLIDLT